MKSGVLISFAVLFAAIAVMGWTAERSVQAIIDREAWLLHTSIVHDSGERFFSTFRDTMASQQSSPPDGSHPLATGDTAAMDSCHHLLSELEDLTRDNPSQQGRISHLDSLLRQDRPFLQPRAIVAGSAPTTGAPSHPSQAMSVRAQKSIEDMRVVVEQFLHEEERLFLERSEAVNLENAHTRWIIELMCATSLIAILGAFLVVARELRLRRRLEEGLLTMNVSLESGVQLRTAQLSQQAQSLLLINAELRHFAKLASHDLQEPLRTISAFCGKLSLNMGGHFDAETCQDMGVVIDAAKRMRQLILDLITYSQVQEHAGVLVAVSLEDALAVVLTLLHTEIQESAAIVQHDPLPSIVSDHRLMVWLLQNLIGNALKYRAASPPRIQISSYRVTNAWEIAIADNGIGIAPRHHERVFELFKRLHGPGHYSGTGLGLALCKRIVELHGGRIRVESELGAGTTIRFTIPDQAVVA